MKQLIFAYLILNFSSVFAQKEITYNKTIKPIFDKHCTNCHFENGYSPFALDSYYSVKKRAEFICHVVENGVMPPWTADTSYRDFKNQNSLSKKEINLIKQWVKDGGIEGGAVGNSHYIKKSSNRKFDSTWCIPMVRSYTVKDLNQDLFKRFYVKTSFDRDVYVSRFEFRPGNRNVVHHSEVFLDSLGHNIPDLSVPGNEQIQGRNYEARIPGLNKFQYITGWLPGEMYEEFPKGIYSKIPKGSNMFFLMHYAATPIEEIDSSVFFIHETKELKDARLAKTVDIHGHRDLEKGSFLIPADTVVTLHCIKNIKEDISAFSLLVHAHHLAKSILAYVVTPKKDTIPLLKIPKWNFDWQFIYKFKKFEIIPKNSTIHYFVEYDNTINNLENPNSPPKDIHYSFEADQEMMELFIYYVPYAKGDEKIQLDY
jgi:hypothetical protein